MEDRDLVSLGYVDSGFIHAKLKSKKKLVYFQRPVLMIDFPLQVKKLLGHRPGPRKRGYLSFEQNRYEITVIAVGKSRIDDQLCF